MRACSRLQPPPPLQRRSPAADVPIRKLRHSSPRHRVVLSLPQYLDSQEPDNALGVIMVPTPRSLAERFADALRPLGAGSTHPARFPALSLSAFGNGTGLLPGKSVGTTSKDCHSDYEVRLRSALGSAAISRHGAACCTRMSSCCRMAR